MFSTNFIKIFCSFLQNNFFETNKKAAKMANMMQNDCCHSNIS